MFALARFWRCRVPAFAELMPRLRLYGRVLAAVGVGCSASGSNGDSEPQSYPSYGNGSSGAGSSGASASPVLNPSFGGHSSGGNRATGGASAGRGGGAAVNGGTGHGGTSVVSGGAKQSLGGGAGIGEPRAGGPGAGAASSSGGAPPVSAGASDPVIPTVSGDCPAFENGTITFMGLAGIRIVAGTKPPEPTAPMLFYWHGTGGLSSEFESLARAVAAGIEQQDGIIVSFQNTTGGDLYSGTSVFGESDLKIVDQLVACAVRDANVDPRRIFTTGCSAGGLFSTAMAALRSSYVAAAAPNSGGYVLRPPFESDQTPPLMTVHGAPGADVVIVDFSETSAAADKYFKSRGGFVINCNTGGGHCGGGSLAADVWTFFQAHPFGVNPTPWAGGLPAGFSDQCTIQ
jgi:predicted esterase